MKHLKRLSCFALSTLCMFLILSCSNQSTPGLKFSNQHAISAGAIHVIALKKDGTVLCLKNSQQLDSLHSSSQCVVSSWTDIISVSAGENFSVGLKNDGTVVATGNMLSEVSSWKDIVEIEATGRHIVGLKKDGTVIGTDLNDELMKWNDIVGVSAGYVFLAGLKQDGRVVVTDNDAIDVADWTDVRKISGRGFFLLGQRKNETFLFAGVPEDTQSTLSTWTGIKDFSAGFEGVVGIHEDGSIVVAGEDNLKISEWTDIIEISDAWDLTVGLKEDGTLEIFGFPLEDSEEITQWTNIGLPD